MSNQVYNVRFAQKSVLEKIMDLVKNFNTCELMIKPIGEVVGRLPNQVYEVHLEGDIKPLRVFFSLQNDGLTITLAEPEYNENTCQSAVTRFIQDIYKKATDKELSKKYIKVNTVGMLKDILCQHCLKPIPTNTSYQCLICNHIYCFAHRFPEKHNCKKIKSEDAFKISSLKPTKKRTNTAAISRHSSKVIITRIPCG